MSRTSIISRTDRTLVHAMLSKLAFMVERAADFGTDTSRRYETLRKTIVDQEKGHRRFAPAGWRHLSSVNQAADFFVVRTIAKARITDTARDLSILREDYVLATFLMCDEGFRERLSEYVGEAFPGMTAGRVFAIMGGLDYCLLSGTADRVDPESRAALDFARTQKAVA